MIAIPPKFARRWFQQMKRYSLGNPSAIRLHKMAQYALRVKDCLSHETIIIHQMGKVASTSVKASLEGQVSGRPIYATHFMNSTRLQNHMRTLKSADQEIPRHLIASQYLEKKIRSAQGHNWKIVTLVRDPVARNISAFFQNIGDFSPSFFHEMHSGTLSMSELVTVFLNEYRHEIPLKWLDLEIKDVFGIDVFSSEFPKARGYKIYENHRYSLLLLKVEKLGECFEEAFQQFLGTPRCEMLAQNVGAEKDYGDYYKRFKSKIRLPSEYLDEMYHSKLCRHFYSKDERDMLRAKWLRV
jgi:hypothetical protein